MVTKLIFILFLIEIIESYSKEIETNYNLLKFQSNHRQSVTQKTRAIVCERGMQFHVIHIYFDPNYSLDIADDVIKSLSECNAAPVFVRTIGKSYRHREIHFVSVHVFVMKQATPRNILKATHSVDKNTKRKTLLRYIFAFFDFTITGGQEMRLAKYLFNIMWKKGVLNAVAVFKTNRVKVLGYNPFSTAGSVEVIDLSDLHYKDLFSDKVKNLNGLLLKVAMFKDVVRAIPRKDSKGYNGADGLLARTIIEHLNATAKYIYPSDENVYGTPRTGTLGDVISGRADVGFNSRYIIKDNLRFVEVTNSFERFNFCIVVPKAKPVSMVWNIFKTLSAYSWLAWLLAFLTTVGFFYTIQQCEKNIANRSAKDMYSFGDVVLFLFQTVFGDTLMRISRLATLRYVLISWLIFSHLLTSIFVGKLVSTLVLPRYHEDLNTLTDFVNSSFELAMPYAHLKPMQVALDNETWHALQPKIVRLNMKYFENLIHRPRNVGFMLRTDKAKYFLAQTYDQTLGRPTYHIMEEVVVLRARVYIVSLGSAFLGKINSLISWLYEAGLVKHWQEMAEYGEVISGRLVRDMGAYRYDEKDNIVVEEGDERKVVLTLEHLQSAFYMWIVGICISLIAFGAEHYHSRWQLKQLKKYDEVVVLFGGYTP